MSPKPIDACQSSGAEMSRKIREICNMKKKVITIAPDATIKEAVDCLNKNNIGCLVVMDGANIAGIVSERDVLRKLADTDVQLDIHSLKTSEIMTPKEKIIVGRLDSTLEYLMCCMNENKIRHIPIVDNEGSLVCLTSIRDIIRVLLKDAKTEAQFLSDYVQGKYPA
ncbi:MAG: CBS domain-containing protein [Candidatus Wallbacteria bacterium]|nr:CBS domain-containing protein [Candidatus Wallbacteria bacterium]